MPRRPKNLLRRGDVWYLRQQIDGKRVWRSLGTSNFAEAKRLLAQEKARMARRRLDRESPTAPTVRMLSERWLADHVMLNRTAQNHRDAAARLSRHVLPVIGSQRLDELNRTHLARLRRVLEAKSLSPQTVHHVLSDVRAMLRYGVETEMIRRSPFVARALLPRIAKRLPARLSDEQLEAILRAAAEEPKYELAIRLAVLTGMRWGELHRLQWRNVRNGRIELELTKSGQVRRIPLSSEALAALEAERGRQKESKSPSVFVLPWRGKNPCTWVNRIGRRAGVRWHFHQLRHTFGCRWMDSGGTLEVLSRILGHSTLAMTQRYAMVGDSYVQSEVDRVSLNTGSKSPVRKVAESSD